MIRTEQAIERFRRVMMRSAPEPMAVFGRGQGTIVWDLDGTAYLDFLAGVAVNALGYAHPAFVTAVTEQAKRMAHISNYFASEAQLDLAERLVRLSGGDRVFFANSGAEAIEAALKLARLTGRPRLVALENSFHGRTMGSLSLTGKPALREPFEPLVPGVTHLEVSIAALEAEFAAHGPEIAALVVEPIQGEAGVVDLPEGYLARARELTTEHGALLILDEIQTGAGRTGEWFAFQLPGMLPPGTLPDAITLAKGIGGGFPIGALVTFGAASELFQLGQHGSTFGGNPLATAVADAVLAEIESAELLAAARAHGERIRSLIRGMESPLVAGLSGAGLLIGVQLTAPVAPAFAAEALERGLIVNAPREDRIRLAPPLILSQQDLDDFAEIFADTLDVLEATTPTGEPS